MHAALDRQIRTVLDVAPALGAYVDPLHHPHARARGGRTDLDNGVPLCGWHHRRAHDDRFDL